MPAAAGIFTPGLQMVDLGSPAPLYRSGTADTDATTMILGQGRSVAQLTPMTSTSDLGSPAPTLSSGLTPAVKALSCSRSPCQSPLLPRTILSILAFLGHGSACLWCDLIHTGL